MKKRIVIRDFSSLSFDEALEKFINFKIAMNKAEHTIAYYEERGNQFCDFLKHEKGVELTSDIIDEHITDYILFKRQNSPSISDNTINNHLRGIRAILYFFMDKGYTKSFHIPLISVKQIPKEGYTRLEQERLLKKPDIKKCNFAQYRNWVIVCQLLASGIRSRTLRYIQNKHVDLQERIITLTEVKNREGYEIPISDEYYPILVEYMKIRGGADNDFLFCNQYGKQLTEDALKSSIREYNLSCGVDKTSTHLFRNTFAKNWLLEGGSTKRLQHALGHKSSKMVDEYARLYGRELREDFSKFTPLAKLKEVISENKKISMQRKRA